ncbi:MAG: hypothetical protein U0871_07190 [Gemmataceae bacterium]
MAKTNTVAGFFGELPDDYKKAERKKPMTQQEKNRTLAGLILTGLFRDGTYSVSRLEEDAARIGITGRVNVNVGAGVGGKGGMELLRDRAGTFLLCWDNVRNLLRHLGQDPFGQWMEAEGVGLDEFGKWMESLKAA